MDLAPARKYSRISGFQEGKMMKTGFVSVCKVAFGVLLCTLLLWLGGCGYIAQPGETAAEGHRRHLRNLSINQQNLMYDLDRAGLIDEPSKAHPRKIN